MVILANHKKGFQFNNQVAHEHSNGFKAPGTEKGWEPVMQFSSNTDLMYISKLQA